MRNLFPKGFKKGRKDYGIIGGALKSIGDYFLMGAIFNGLMLLVLFFVKGEVWLGDKVLPWLFIIM